MPTINFKAIQNKIDSAVEHGAKTREIKAKLKAGADAGAALVIERMQKEFDDHRITKALSQDPTASAGLAKWPTEGKNGGRYGNLISFLGLLPEKASSDLSALRALLQFREIKIRKLKSGQFSINVRFNPVSTYYNSATFSHGSGSWLRALEKSELQNFSEYLFRKKGISASRTGTGIQTNNTLRKGVQSIPEYPFITEIYNKILGSTIAKRLLASSIKNAI